jgi:hypothetical protein
MGDKCGWNGFSLMYVTGLENNLEEVDHAWKQKNDFSANTLTNLLFVKQNGSYLICLGCT